jgi:hypothetical protein
MAIGMMKPKCGLMFCKLAKKKAAFSDSLPL